MSEFALEVTNLTKVYENNTIALKGINLTIPIGSRIAFQKFKYGFIVAEIDFMSLVNKNLRTAISANRASLLYLVSN